jgi:hypothetical protein
VIPVFIHSNEKEENGGWPLGGASKFWLHQSLTLLDAQIRSKCDGIGIVYVPPEPHCHCLQ